MVQDASCNICNINYKVIIVLSDFKPWFLSRAFYLLFFYFQHIRNMERGVFSGEKIYGACYRAGTQWDWQG